MNKIALFFVFIFFSIKSYSQMANGKVENGVFRSDIIEWKVNLPQGYEVISNDERVRSGEATAQKLKKDLDKSNTVLLLSLKKSDATPLPKFLSGLQNRMTVGIPINTESDFIMFAIRLVKKSTPDAKVFTFKKQIDNKDFSGYQIVYPTGITQKGLIKIVGKWVFYQTWLYQKEEEVKNVEEKIYSATFGF